MTKFVAYENTPGYSPDDTDPPVFDSAREAWNYLADSLGDDGYEPDDPGDPHGPHSRTRLALELEKAARKRGVGTVYGATPGYDGDHDLCRAFSVEYAEDED